MLAAANDTTANPTDSETTLRDEIAQLAEDVKRLAEFRARQAKRAAEETIDEYPVATMAGAFAIGAMIGLVLTAPRSQSSARDEIDRYTRQLRDQVRSAARQSSMADALETLGSRLSAPNAQETAGPIINRVMSWLTEARKTAQATVEKVAEKVAG
jgi:ElaB/YqjD/DUF883 family membrane-anchored ribosome-binding protein